MSTIFFEPQVESNSRSIDTFSVASMPGGRSAAERAVRHLRPAHQVDEEVDLWLEIVAWLTELPPLILSRMAWLAVGIIAGVTLCQVCAP